MTFASVAESCLDDVFGYLLYLTKDRPLAEDLTGETFETACRRWRRFDPRRGTPRAWLLAIARSTALDWFRADARRRRREERAGARELQTRDDLVCSRPESSRTRSRSAIEACGRVACSSRIRSGDVIVSHPLFELRERPVQARGNGGLGKAEEASRLLAPRELAYTLS